MKLGWMVPLLFVAGCASGTNGPTPQAAESRLADLQTSLTELLERLDVLNDRIARLEQAQSAPPASASISPPPSPTPSSRPAETPSNIASSAQRAVLGAQIAQNYREAIVLFGKNRAAEARSLFQQVFDADPSGDLADNALFWIGETYYTGNDHQNAIRFYRRVSEEYGDQNKAPDALFKLALAYEKTGDLVLARKTFQEVITRYPYSAPAATAKAELNRIKY